MPDPFDYVELANIAKELVDDTGRDVKFIRFNQSNVEAGKEWRGSGPDPAGNNPDATATLKATFVPPTSISELGKSGIDEDLIKLAEQICIVAPGATFAEDLATFNVIEDGAIKWKIVSTETLRPANITLAYFIGVRR